MASAGSFRVEGLDQLRRALQQLPEQLQQRVISTAVAKGARVVASAAKRLAPVDSGNLRRNIRSTRGVRRQSEASAFVSVRKLTRKRLAALKQKRALAGKRAPEDAFYWRFHEFGTSKMEARSFIRPAFNQNTEKAAGAIKDELRGGIEREAKKLAWGSRAR